MSNGNGKVHHIPEAELEEWANQLSQGGRIKVRRSRPNDEEDPEDREDQKKNPRRKERREMNDNVRPQVEVVPTVPVQNPPQPQPIARQKPVVPLLEIIIQISDLQKKRDELQARLNEIEAEHAQVLAVRRKAEEQIRFTLETITKWELGLLQTQLIIAEPEKAEEIRQVVKGLSEVANRAGQIQLAITAENYIKTAEGFRLVWQELTEEQRKERALVARVNPDNANAFYRASLAYDKGELTQEFLKTLPPQWRQTIEGKPSIAEG